MTYAGIQFEVARSNDLGGDTFTGNVTDRGKDGHRNDHFGGYELCGKNIMWLLT